jgi:hypothetical protein
VEILSVVLAAAVGRDLRNPHDVLEVPGLILDEL